MTNRKVTDEMLITFKTKLKEEEKTNNTIEKYMRDIRYFLRFTLGREVNKSLAIEYKAFLEEKYAIVSANSMLAALNSFLRFLEWHDLCVKQFRVQRQAYCSENKELTKSEYRSLVRTAERKNNERLSLVIQTICGTGIRVSELPYVRVEAARKGAMIVSCKGKTRTVFLISKLCKKLLAYAKKQKINSGMIFITKNRKALNRSNVWCDMKKLCKEAGVNPEKVFPHNLRHLFARTFYGIEKDIAKLADILGHSSINTTRIYIMSSGAEHKRKLENMRLII